MASPTGTLLKILQRTILRSILIYATQRQKVKGSTSERASRRDNMKKTYQFDVPCVYYYEIDAGTEEQARKILLDKGGMDLEGDLCLDEDNYKRAELVGVLQPQASEKKG